MLRTMPQPIYCISTEEDPWKSIEQIESLGEAVDFKPVTPTTAEDLVDTLNKIIVDAHNGDFPFKSILFDSATYFMNVTLTERVEDDRNENKNTGKLKDVTEKGWGEIGTINDQMRRITGLFKKISKLGVFVGWTAQMESDPKWNRELAAAPAFSYKEYNKVYKGFFDYIGFLIPCVTDGKVVFPPYISFSSPDDSYVVKWRGKQLETPTGPCDFRKIFPDDYK